MEALNSTMSSLENNIGHVTEESYIVTSLGSTISDAMEESDALTSLSNMSDVLPNETSLPYDARPETYIVPVVFALIFVVGVLGNGTLVYIFLRH
uniref:Uncharacterized protein n=1 Tax=Timema bartmani TaxID=61472 RepID=A0A7R9F678_9NEOP|nr:unnamed protein product [Timema bartmani]